MIKVDSAHSHTMVGLGQWLPVCHLELVALKDNLVIPDSVATADCESTMQSDERSLPTR